MEDAQMPRIVFVTGIGTGVGKTLVSSIVCECLHADYWKPVQSGFEGPTDSEVVSGLLEGGCARVLPETYRLKNPLSPHHAARIDGVRIDPRAIMEDFRQHASRGNPLVIEGAGGLLVPLNEKTLFADLIREMGIPVILVTVPYLGSINHSLLTASLLRERGIPSLGWVFNRSDGIYDQDIARWSSLPALISLPPGDPVQPSWIRSMATRLTTALSIKKPEAIPLYG